MKVRQKTLQPYNGELSKYETQLENDGYKRRTENRVPKGTTEKVVINIRRWCGNWSGWKTFKNQVVYYK